MHIILRLQSEPVDIIFNMKKRELNTHVFSFISIYIKKSINYLLLKILDFTNL